MGDTSFRTASIEDIDALRRFERGVISTERVYDPTLKAGNIEYYDIDTMLVAEHVRFVVAERDNELVGCGFARIDVAKPYLSHPRQAYLGLMYVDPDHRGQAINRGILDILKQWCRSQRVSELRLEVYGDNLAAIAAYEKSGFSTHIIEMRLRLSGDAGASDPPAASDAA